MKRSKADTAETRKHIVECAGREFRQNGIRATGVAEIMAAAGLTHGAFYRHFSSKDQLVAEACAASMDSFVGSTEAAAECGDESLKEHIRFFLSKEYHDAWSGGCPLVAVGSELARADMDTRRAASDGFRQLVDIMARQEADSDPLSARSAAMFKVSAMIGAVTMSRIMDDPALAEWILDEAKKRLAAPSEKPRKKRAAAKPA